MRAIFLDRDGVINQKAAEGEYITTLEEFVLLPGVAETIATLCESGFAVCVVTNQRGLARGRVSSAELVRMHAELRNAVERAGGRIRQIYICPHDVADGCECRKPKPGMLLAAIRDHRIDAAKSWMIGDSASDVLAGKAAGCRTIFVGPREAGGRADACVDSLRNSLTVILGH
ncbi:MAG TPA: HAD family hydrolase [Terriglobales bacterium]|nr:HAD family hydrolase [Terriglobales bacterium]